MDVDQPLVAEVVLPHPAQQLRRATAPCPTCPASSHSSRNSVRVSATGSPHSSTSPADGGSRGHPTRTAALVGGLGAGAPAQRPQPGGQLLHRHRLDEVVVGAGLERRDDVVGVVAGADDDDRDVAGAAQRADEVVAVHARQGEVDEHGVGGVAAQRGEARPRRWRRRRTRCPSSSSASSRDSRMPSSSSTSSRELMRPWCPPPGRPGGGPVGPPRSSRTCHTAG